MMNIHTFLFKTITEGEANHSANIKQYDRILLSETLKDNRLIDSFMYYYPNFKFHQQGEDYSVSSSNTKLSELNMVVNILSDHKVNYVVLKGLAMRKYYPEHLPRQSIDFDFLIKDINEFLKVYKELEELGYTLDYYPIFTSEIDETKGVVALKKELPGEHPIYIEFNIGGFLISEGTWLDDEDIWNSAKKTSYKNMEIVFPNDEWNIILLISEFGGNKNPRIRDAVDYYFILKSMPNINSKYLYKKIKDWCLGYQYSKFLKYYSNINNNTYIEKNTRYNKILRMINMEIWHIIPLTLKKLKLQSLKKIIYHYLRHAGNYLNLKEIKLDLLKRYENIILPVDRVYYSGVHVNLVQLSDTTTNEWIILSDDKCVVITCPMGSFLMSNYCIHEEEELERATNLSEKVS
ncbi:nucleotidyltransferase family protein [Virgibacillus pantothenticus]|uniref:nucleotidyltransferase family protein n=1 Tax=Virgibacillus pantothenticus TaxID=1473 RepID=UPI00147F2A48|nr:nucleotidyltransferase family protein [Virgibacillus pantothenticus]